MKAFVVLTICLLSLARSKGCEDLHFCTSNLPAPCPAVQYITNVDISQLVGNWYRLWTTRDVTSAGCNGDCVTLQVAQTEPNAAAVTECCRAGTTPLCNDETGSGYAYYVNNYPGGIHYSTNGIEIPLYFLDLNYTSYFIDYSCSVSECGEKQEFLDIYSRTPVVCQEQIDAWIAVLVNNGIDPAIISAVLQYPTCPYNF